MVTFTINGPINNRISKLPAQIQANIYRAVEDGMLLAERNSQTKYMTGPRPEKLGVVTGLLRSRVKGRVIKMGGGAGIFAIGTLGVSGVVYAAIHELGGKTSPHTITAKNAPYLVFFWKKKGIWMRIKSVNHPGSTMPARPYLRPSLEETMPTIKNLIELAIARAQKTGG